MLRSGLIAMAMVMALGMTLGGCKSDAEKACFDNPPKNPKTWASACGEACDHAKNKKACAKLAEIGAEHCFKKGNREVCRWLCEFAKTGADVYCKHMKKLDAAKKK